MSRVNVGAFEPHTMAMGPGARACLWVKGCSINCPGCATPEFIPTDPGLDWTVSEICERIRTAKSEYAIEGISFSGGEPFEQAPALTEIAHFARSLELSVLSWSGYTKHHLDGPRAPIGSAELISALDVLIDGPFVSRLVTNLLPLRGSQNQRIHLLTNRYSPDHFRETSLEARQVDVNSSIVTGVVDSNLLRAVTELMGISHEL